MTDFAIHTRVACLTCIQGICLCVECQGVSAMCGRGDRKFPLHKGCNWNTILTCPSHKEK